MYPYITQLLISIASFTVSPCCSDIEELYPDTIVERNVTYSTPTPEMFLSETKNKIIVYKKAPRSWGKVFNN